MYLDTSVLVKLYVREVDSEFYGRLVDGQPVSSSMLGYTEVWAALAAKERAQAISRGLRTDAWRTFVHDVPDDLIGLVSVSEAIVRRANSIIERVHPHLALRSLDALHLASADQLQDWPLVTHDVLIRQAAELLAYPLSPLPS